jgi:hypothetical protein
VGLQGKAELARGELPSVALPELPHAYEFIWPLSEVRVRVRADGAPLD